MPTPLHAHHSCLRIAVKSNAHSRFPSLLEAFVVNCVLFLFPLVYYI